jgi:hypothetical protein
MKGRKEERMFETTRWRKTEESTTRNINTIEIKTKKDTDNPSERTIDTIVLINASMKRETSKKTAFASRTTVVKKNMIAGRLRTKEGK